jgi:signal peptidase II
MDLRAASYGGAGVIFLLDRFTKWLIETRVALFETHTVIPGFFAIVHTKNQGAAFGFLNDSAASWRGPLLIGLSMAALIVVAGMLWRPGRLDRWTMLGLTSILGGALGNLVDRIAAGQVTDFLDFYVGNWHWPAFNVADSAIVIGGGLLLLSLIAPRSEQEAART